MNPPSPNPKPDKMARGTNPPLSPRPLSLDEKKGSSFKQRVNKVFGKNSLKLSHSPNKELRFFQNTGNQAVSPRPLSASSSASKGKRSWHNLKATRKRGRRLSNVQAQLLKNIADNYSSWYDSSPGSGPSSGSFGDISPVAVKELPPLTKRTSTSNTKMTSPALKANNQQKENGKSESTSGDDQQSQQQQQPQEELPTPPLIAWWRVFKLANLLIQQGC